MISLPWKQIGVALAALALLYAAYAWAYSRGAHSRDPEVAAHLLTIANMKAASAEATAKNLAHVREVETRNSAIQKEQEDALAERGDAARAAVAQYIRLHLAPKANPGDAGAGGLSGASSAAGSPAGSGQMSVVDADDLLACTDAVVTAVGWQAWWGKVSGLGRP